MLHFKQHNAFDRFVAEGVFILPAVAVKRQHTGRGRQADNTRRKSGFSYPLMTKKQSSILTRLGTLVPDVDKICTAYGVDQRRAKKIQGSISAILEMVGDLVVEQAEFVEGQEITAGLIEREIGRERDAVTILRNIDVFLAGEPVTIQYILEQVFLPVFAEAFGKLEPPRQQALFASLREAVNSLKKHHGILAEP